MFNKWESIYQLKVKSAAQSLKRNTVGKQLPHSVTSDKLKTLPLLVFPPQISIKMIHKKLTIFYNQSFDKNIEMPPQCSSKNNENATSWLY